MDQPRAMGRGEASARLHELVEEIDLHPMFGSHPLAQSLPFDILHGHERMILAQAHLIDVDDVRVRESSHRLCLSEHPLPALLVLSDNGSEDLDGNLSIELRIMGLIDDPHAALSELAYDSVATDAERTGRSSEEPLCRISLIDPYLEITASYHRLGVDDRRRCTIVGSTCASTISDGTTGIDDRETRITNR